MYHNQTAKKMENQILILANQVVKHSNFTRLQKRKKAGQCFLIVTTADFDLYGSFSSNAVYAIVNNNIFLLK